ncbi:ATP-binding cassette domain-containing protein [Marinomonas piezotolerans]|uniref:ATP-binding cassette domain-containing protein n=1 Tax=Marinomonas piezotolerans TaxID=2213058 RepID=UPI001FE3CB5F|nr:ATP-binding cassette domain-containing protein [Marinomonas piezotolerans]
MLALKDIQVFNQQEALISPFSATIENGTILAVMGPSGIGKSTLLAYLADSLPAGMNGKGEIWLNDKPLNPLPAEKRQLGLLQQAPLLFPHMSVEENIRFALPSNSPKHQRRELTMQSLASVGLSEHANKLPQHLSGGQQARLALARTLSSQPNALLLDEPFSKLDQSLRTDMRKLVLLAVKEHNIPAILVTHDPEDATAISHDTCYLSPAP